MEALSRGDENWEFALTFPSTQLAYSPQLGNNAEKQEINRQVHLVNRIIANLKYWLSTFRFPDLPATTTELPVIRAKSPR